MHTKLSQQPLLFLQDLLRSHSLKSCYVLFMDGLGFLLSLLAPEPFPCDQMGPLEVVAAPWKLVILLPGCEGLTGHSTWKKCVISFTASYQRGFLALFSNRFSPGTTGDPRAFLGTGWWRPPPPPPTPSFPWIYMRKFPLEISYFLTLLIDVQATICLQVMTPAVLLVICITKETVASVFILQSLPDTSILSLDLPSS